MLVRVYAWWRGTARGSKKVDLDRLRRRGDFQVDLTGRPAVPVSISFHHPEVGDALAYVDGISRGG